jgi:hypothetical protein
MKVLFVGEGPHDIGRDENAAYPPTVANGVVPILVRKVVPTVMPDSVAIKWREITLFSLKTKKFDSEYGLDNKVAAAILVSARRFGCEGTICVRDQDKAEGLVEILEEGVKKGLQKVGGYHKATFGLVIESIEAWSLGAPSALAAVLNVPKSDIENKYRVRDVERFHEKSGKVEHRPKKILEQVADMRNRHPGTEFRKEVADATDIAELEKNCPYGFQPFAKRLRDQFGEQNV